MDRHFTFSDRVILQYFIETTPRGTAKEAGAILGKSRQAVHYELKHNIYHYTPKSISFNEGKGNIRCPHLKRFPYCCNNCARTSCSHRSSEYNAYKAQEKAHKRLVNSRVDTAHRKNIIDILDKTVSQLIIDGLSIKVAKLSVNRCDVSESTIRRYLNNGLLRARRHHLPNAVRFKVKKQYDYSRKQIDVKILYKRTYQDYLDYMAANPLAKVIQVDSLIGKVSDRSAFLTVFFVNSKFQLVIKYNRTALNINSILLRLYNTALENGFKLFDVILTDNGPEFMKFPALEMDDDNVLRARVFYCDPYRSCQKAECERNHGLIRRIFRKGKSFSSVSQTEIDNALSHINSYPRGSLNNRAPYDLFVCEYDYIIATIFNIDKIPLEDLRLKAR